MDTTTDVGLRRVANQPIAIDPTGLLSVDTQALRPNQGGGEILRKAPKSITGLLRGLLRDITDITGFYYGYYGTFCVCFQ